MSQPQIITDKKLNWVNISQFDAEDYDYLIKLYDFNPHDLRACYPPLERPQVRVYPEYTFLTLHFPVLNEETGRIGAEEWDFFIGEKFCISINEGKNDAIEELFVQCEREEMVRKVQFHQGSIGLTYEILNRLFLGIFPLLNRMSLNIDRIDEGLFDENNESMVTSLLGVKQNITEFRKIMQGHKRVLEKLMEEPGHLKMGTRTAHVYHRLIEYTKEIWDSLLHNEQTIDALHNAHTSLITVRANQAMRVLTAFAVIIFPLTLIATLFSMSVRYIPFADHPYAFWYIAGAIGAIGIAMWVYFRKKHWL